MLVQFGNNWIQKIPLTAKLDSACGLVQFGQHVVLLHIQIVLHSVLLPLRIRRYDVLLPLNRNITISHKSNEKASLKKAFNSHS